MIFPTYSEWKTKQINQLITGDLIKCPHCFKGQDTSCECPNCDGHPCEECDGKGTAVYSNQTQQELERSFTPAEYDEKIALLAARISNYTGNAEIAAANNIHLYSCPKTKRAYALLPPNNNVSIKTHYNIQPAQRTAA